MFARCDGSTVGAIPGDVTPPGTTCADPAAKVTGNRSVADICCASDATTSSQAVPLALVGTLPLNSSVVGLKCSHDVTFGPADLVGGERHLQAQRVGEGVARQHEIDVLTVGPGLRRGRRRHGDPRLDDRRGHAGGEGFRCGEAAGIGRRHLDGQALCGARRGAAERLGLRIEAEPAWQRLPVRLRRRVAQRLALRIGEGIRRQGERERLALLPALGWASVRSPSARRALSR